MTFEEFLAHIRAHIGQFCSDTYWQKRYNILPDKSREYIEREMPFLAVRAVGAYHASKNG